MFTAVDPWFNFRATKYLVQNGFYSFWDWFDDRKHSYLEALGVVRGLFIRIACILLAIKSRRDNIC